MKFFDFPQTIDQLPDEGLDRLPNRVIPFVWFFTRQIKARFIALCLLGISAGILSALAPFFFGKIVGSFVDSANRDTIWITLGSWLAAYTVLVLILAPALYNFQGWLSSKTLAYYAAMIRRQLALYLHRHSYRYFQDDFAGRLAGKVVEMPYAMRLILSDITGPFIYAGVMFLTTLAIFSWIGSSFAGFTAAYMILYAINLGYFVPRIRALAEGTSRKRSVMRGRFVDILTNIFLVKIFARREYEDRYFREALHDVSDAASEWELKVTTMFRAQHVINSVFMFALVLATVHGWQQGGMTTAQITMILPMALSMIQATFWLTEVYTAFFERLGEVQEGMEAIVQAHDVTDKPGAGVITVREPSIVFENMTFNYPSRPMFDNFTLRIPPRQRVGLVGPSGAGKSSLMQLLLRLHDVQGGRILIDGQDIAQVTQDSVRDSIAFIPQSADLLHRTVRDNIAYGRLDADDAAIENATRIAQAHDFIGSLRDTKGGMGYDATVGERGVKLSGGQRQRIAIARAVLKDAPIVVLDEATASLDSESERMIQDSFKHLMEGRTVVAIAHRLSTIAHLDRLIVMDQGKIVEDGTHAELLSRGGLYARLWGLQSGGFLGA
jgi:ATP-binding cassette subfamily B multidrug efflux pump